MKTLRLGASGPTTAALGLGCMGMSGVYGHADRAESIATIHAALETGVTLIDTGDFYNMGHNELLVAEALRDRRREDALISVKFGALRDAAGAFIGYDCRPAAVKNFLAYSLVRLGTDHVDVYRPARIDPDVPIEETVGAIAEEVKAGRVRHIGLSEVSAATIRRAAAVHPICDVQIEYSLMSRGIEDDILPTCRELGIAITAYGVLARGLLGGRWRKDGVAKGDWRGVGPRFQGDNVDRNLELVEALRRVAEARGVGVAEAAIAWVAARGNDIVSLIGARTRGQLASAAAGVDLALTPGDMAAIEAAVPKGSAAGDRYPAAAMAHLDSEHG